MRFRKLRIAWSVGCGVFCLLLIALWVRSYRRTEFVERMVSVNRLYASGVQERIVNGRGKLEFFKESVVNNSQVNYTPPGWKYRAYDGVADQYKSLAWKTRFAPQSVVSIPHHFAVLLVGGGGVAPWIRWSKRFSLRTLLIATTLVAVVLGLIVWLR